MKTCISQAAWAHSSFFHPRHGISLRRRAPPNVRDRFAGHGRQANVWLLGEGALPADDAEILLSRHCRNICLIASAAVHVLPQVFLGWTDHKTERHRTHDADQRSGRLDTPLSKDRNALPRFHRACRSVLSYRIAGSASAKLGRYGRFSGQYRRDGATGKLARDYPEV